MTRSLTAPVHDAPTVASLLGITYTANELAALGPPPEPLEGFVTFFDPGLSILRIRDAVKGKGRVFWAQDWYDRELFAAAVDIPRYRQVRAGPVPNSFRKTFDEQTALLPEGEEVPSARAVVTALVIHFLATGERLLPNVYVRSADQTARGDRVCVGSFDSDGLYVGVDWDGGRIDYLGLASSRKF